MKLSYSTVNKHWVLLDNQLEVNAFLNTKLLKKVRHVEILLDINFNEVVENNDLVGDLPEYTEVSIYIKIIENILSLERVKEK